MNKSSYCRDKGINHYQDLFGNSPSFPWMNDIIVSPEDLENFEYYKYSGVSDNNVIIALDDVIGSHHIDYHGMQWIEMFGCLKHGHQSSVQIVEKWLNTCTNTISLNKYDNKYYVGGDGNHRVCYAKFLGYNKLKVHSVSYYELDEKHLRYKQELSKLNLKINSWSNERYDVQMEEFCFIISPSDINTFINLFNSASQNLVDRVYAKYFKDILIHNKYFRFDPEDLSKLKKISKIIAYCKSRIR